MNRKLIIYFSVGVAAGLIIATSFGWGAKPNADIGVPSREALSVERGASSTASLMLDYGDGSVKVYKDLSVATGETMMQLLEKTTQDAKLEFTTKSYAGLGKIVESIGRKKNGANNMYWQYWVNNQYVPVGAESYVVKPGDVISWKFINYKQEER